jgi:general secretion pathway protein J
VIARRPALRTATGLTLLEVLIALTILSVIVGVLITSLRVGVRAWEAGERRAAVQQEVRALTELLTEALSSTTPFRGRLGEGLDRVVLFEGEPDEVHFVTTAPPLILDAPAAPFHAVRLRRASDDQLKLTERLVPADEPFTGGQEIVLARSVHEFRLEYRNTEGLWADRWDPRSNTGIPAAVRVRVSFRESGRSERPERTASLMVPMPLATAAAQGSQRTVPGSTPFPLVPQPSGTPAPTFPPPAGGGAMPFRPPAGGATPFQPPSGFPLPGR